MVLIMLASVAGCGGNTQTPDKNTPAAKTIAQEMANYYVDVPWLQANLDKVVILDARAEKEYKNGHIPGAINVPWQSLSNMKPKQGEPGWGVVLAADQLAAKLGEFGIDGKKPVVVYNDPAGLGEEGRVLWMLRIARIDDSRMLYGGWPAWKAVDGKVTKDVPPVTPVKFTIASPDNSRLATTDYLKTRQNTIKLVDARSPEEYKGQTDHGEKQRGHIPGAIHIHYRDTYTDDGYAKSIPELKKIFTEAGLNPQDDIVTYCTVGIRSGYLAEVLRMCGYEKAKNYNASFSEWCGDPGNPVEK